ncbi:MAG: polysaccharide deacetylase family protein [Bacteroidales bacterium]|nr:polysaccharide deacetylase family protein [Bacteroidales bacterium]
MILVYVNNITPRLKYIFDLVFTDILKTSYSITDIKTFFTNSDGAKFNYSSEKFDNELFIHSSDLLFQTWIEKQEIEVTDWNGLKIFFQTDSQSDLPFDIFAASFYLVSRYEEYLPFSTDKHKRFKASDSLAFIHNFLKEPIVNKWVDKFSELLISKYPDLQLPNRHFHFIPTIDIDNAYYFKGKGLIRTLGACLKSFFHLKNNFTRFQVIFGLKKDPFDNFRLLRKVHANYKPVYFFLIGKYGLFDRNISIKHKRYKKLIKSMSRYDNVGIHPSYSSNNNFEVLKKEVNNLSEIINKEVTKSRNHFLRLKFPETYQSLIKLNIEEDYTMGYSSQIGFRAGICTPFLFYDLTKEEITNLKIFPFAFMDVTFIRSLKLTPKQALFEMKKIITEINTVNGTLISLWHNETFSNINEYKGWKFIYQEMMRFFENF